MSEYQISTLSYAQNLINMLLGSIIKTKTNTNLEEYISQKLGYLCQTKLQTKFESLLSSNKNIIYTFFIKNNSQFIRFATTEQKDGIYQINTTLSTITIPYNSIINNKTFIGFEKSFDTLYYCSYEPIIDYINKSVIGCIFIGVTNNINDINFVDTKEINMFNIIDDIIIMIFNLFGNITLLNGVLISHNRGQLNYDNTQNILIDICNQVNYKTISITLYKFINNNFIQISCTNSDINIDLTNSQSNLIYQSLINKQKYKGTITISGISYYITYIPILDTETNNLIGSYYINFGPFNMI